MNRVLKSSLILILMPFIFSCNSKRDLETVSSLDLEKYSGLWYEITKLPNRFERDLKCVTATYTIKDDGRIEVYNRGFHIKKDSYNDITGKAKVPDDSRPGEIKVSFFGPFYGDYYVMDIDEDYQTVLVGSPSRKYLWILARTKDIPQERYDALVALAKAKGFEVDKLEKMVHNCD